MDLRERMTKSIESFIRFGGSTKKVELDAEEMATIDDLKDDGVTDFKTETFQLTREVAMKVTALNEGINQISDAIAALPVYLYKREQDGSREKCEDKRNMLLNIENSKHSTAFNMKKNLIVDFLFYGNGYLDINRDVKNEIISLMHIPYKDLQLIDVNPINKREAEYQYSYWGLTNEFHEVLNLARNPYKDQLSGVGILEEGAMALEGAIGLDEYSKNVVRTGFNARGVIESEKVMSKPSRQSLTSMLKKFFSGGRNAGKILILDDGMKFKGLSLSPSDMSLLEQKTFTVSDIARLLKIPGYMLGATGSSMVYSNVEQTQLMFLQMTIDPILRLVEDTLNKYLLTEEEKQQGYFFEFSTQSMLRTTPEKEINMYAAAVKGSLLTVNEARRKLNWGYLEGMDRPIVASGTCIINEHGEVIGANYSTPAAAAKGGDEN